MTVVCPSCGEVDIPEERECCDICEYDAQYSMRGEVPVVEYSAELQRSRYCGHEDYPCCGCD